ncbi:MAG: hypothetical protein HFF06_01660 [Oscillospiraceae bacterium]|nr:hypothetical protein [Oscillospiraceae bacterium]
MVLEKAGQSVSLNGKLYTVGEMVWAANKLRDGKFGVIHKIRINSHGRLIALCEFAETDITEIHLAALEPISQAVPTKIGQQYTLSYYYDGSGGMLKNVLGISPDKSVLLRLMLEDMKETPDVPLTASFYCVKEDVLRFVFENDEPNDPTYVEYTIMPTPVYPKSKEATV